MSDTLQAVILSPTRELAVQARLSFDPQALAPFDCGGSGSQPRLHHLPFRASLLPCIEAVLAARISRLFLTSFTARAAQVAAIGERLCKGGSGRRKQNPVRVQRLIGRPNPIMTVRAAAWGTAFSLLCIGIPQSPSL